MAGREKKEQPHIHSKSISLIGAVHKREHTGMYFMLSAAHQVRVDCELRIYTRGARQRHSFAVMQLTAFACDAHHKAALLSYI